MLRGSFPHPQHPYFKSPGLSTSFPIDGTGSRLRFMSPVADHSGIYCLSPASIHTISLPLPNRDKPAIPWLIICALPVIPVGCTKTKCSTGEG
ncbi:hypothetical protein M413DRAFT_351574 [Hebeloma cylindrosporum]|uniref:Uncharacterized protein n=1 Tax=Hebeloma cylindrosporum TaxID=76867 RepID=A0A0C3BEQ1_HEBCY|nr:hypothetical protein M413DRAFT_351574 [Hebeloma cylindrosporum h7]